MDPEKCWGQIDNIIGVLDQGFKYLVTEEIGESKTTKKEATFLNLDTVYDD